ncbi:hypothetical protein IC220_07435 [Wolbachia endosymbiont of Pentalonia nigronervosa]|uniref:hypothetical protein n=1 Tax=Wolbachia endosymbiont of Pentalonia nigronervosa TaxID=1301914 RepID=UPI00165F6D18|nr:hypothetical protein [Wolbachia endosymbiont of Pentalonia nigronervosa]MBD0392226.1 hypothetical protein [Wolbachia endosymbiont of Pentalonia nigronervosa]
MNTFLKKVELIYIRGLIKEIAMEFQISFGKKTSNFLKYIAERQNKTIPKLIRRLVFEALETREDKYFSKIADERLANDKIVPSSEVDWEKLFSSNSESTKGYKCRS